MSGRGGGEGRGGTRKIQSAAANGNLSLSLGWYVPILELSFTFGPPFNLLDGSEVNHRHVANELHGCGLDE